MYVFDSVSELLNSSLKNGDIVKILGEQEAGDSQVIHGKVYDANYPTSNREIPLPSNNKVVCNPLPSTNSYIYIGDLDDKVGNQLEYNERFNAYRYPAGSEIWWGPIQSQEFPITIPADPSTDEGWVVVNKPKEITEDERMVIHAEQGGSVLTRVDDSDNSHVMIKIPAFTNKMVNDTLGTNWQPANAFFPAFVDVNGRNKEYFEIAMYIASDGAVVGFESQPHKKPYYTSFTHDDISGLRDKVNRECGDGWHICGAAQWAAVSLWCLMNEYQPCGDTSFGRSHTKPWQSGIMQEGFIPGNYYSSDTPRSLVGTGPNAWRHDNSPTGVADMVGLVHELTDGVKLVEGQFFAANHQAQDESEWLVTGSFLDYVNSSGNIYQFNNERTANSSSLKFEKWSDISKSEAYVPNQLLQQLLIEPLEGTAELEGDVQSYNLFTQRVFRGGHFKSDRRAGLAAMHITSTKPFCSLRLCYFPD